MLAHAHRLVGGDGVAVIGRADRDGVDLIAHLVEHFAEVMKLLRAREAGGAGREVLVVNVADGDHIAVLARVFGIARALARDADRRELNFLVR